MNQSRCSKCRRTFNQLKFKSKQIVEGYGSKNKMANNGTPGKKPPSRPPPPRRSISAPGGGTSSLERSYAPPVMNDYVLTEKLGKGTYAVVYKGFRKGNVRDIVAVKCIKKSTLSKTSTENLLREIEILKSLDHQHIVKLKDFQWDDNNIFLILEYCSGGDLSSYIKRYRRLPEKISRKFLRQLALALLYLREKNVSHMDLKPQNLLIESKHNCVLKVGDFGFAQYLLGKEGHDNLRGSPLYMAVEMFNSDTYDASVDLWSTGVILHETLFGFAPFASKTFEELEKKIISIDEIIIPTHPPVSQHSKNLLSRLLERDPLKRITFDDFFTHPFVDIEHAPGPESLSKAITIVKKAISLDETGDSKGAIESYCSALEYFLPAIDYEPDYEKRNAIRKKIKQYVNRAEQLKRVCRQSVNKPKMNRSLSIDECIQRLPGLSEALRHAENGDKFDDDKQYDKALDEYYTAIEKIMKVLKTLPTNSPTHASVRQKVDKMMTRAEEITRYRDIFAKGNDTFSGHSCCIQ